MTLSELLIKVPELENYLRYMPEELKTRCTIKTYPPKTIIHQKDAELDYFGIVCEGYHRVINEFENGNVFMIERNDPIDFVGEVAILAGKPRTSVTIETTTDCTVLYFPEKILKTGLKKISTSCAWSLRKWHISYTVPPTTGVTGCSTRPSTCSFSIFSSTSRSIIPASSAGPEKRFTRRQASP